MGEIALGYRRFIMTGMPECDIFHGFGVVEGEVAVLRKGLAGKIPTSVRIAIPNLFIETI